MTCQVSTEHHFGVGEGRVSDARGKKIDAIARRFGATFTWIRLPGDGWRFWFSAPNRGEPFDGMTRAAVFASLAELDMLDADGRVSRGKRS